MLQDMDYLAMLASASPEAFDRFRQVTSLARHREAVPSEASLIAGLVGVMAEDCGPCVQILVHMARDGGVRDETIEAVLMHDEARLPSDDTKLAFLFARAIVARSPAADRLRDAVTERWGDKGLIDLTMATQVNRIYPMVKRGLGFARSCETVTLGEKSIVPKLIDLADLR